MTPKTHRILALAAAASLAAACQPAFAEGAVLAPSAKVTSSEKGDGIPELRAEIAALLEH